MKGEEAYENAKKEYRFFASNIQKIVDNKNGEGYYIQDHYTERFGQKEPEMFYPLTFIYIDGELNLEASYSGVGYGWTKTEESFKNFIKSFNDLKGGN